MAFLPTYDEEAQKREDEQGGARLNPIAAGPAAAAPAPQAAPAGPSPGSAMGTGPYVNFARYIDANKDVANSTAQSVAGTVDKSAAGAQSGLQTAQTKFQQGMQAGSPFNATPRQILASSTASGVNPMAKFQGQATSAVIGRPSPEQGLRGTPQIGMPEITPEEARRRAAATYSGPTGLGVSSQLRQQTSSAASQLAATGKEDGRQTLLREQYGQGGGYTKGANDLDAALVGSVGSKRFSDLRAKYGDLVGKLEGGERSAKRQADAATAATNATANNYSTQVGKWEADEVQRKRQDEAKAQQEAAAREQAQRDRQAQEHAQARREHRDRGETTSVLTDEQEAARGGHYDEWWNAGRPPYNEWIASKGY